MFEKPTRKEEMQQVAAISADNDNEIGRIMADAIEKAGKDADLVENGKTAGTALVYVPVPAEGPGRLTARAGAPAAADARPGSAPPRHTNR
jgi:hypothetical protein